MKDGRIAQARVAVVEDDVDIRTMLVLVLEMGGYEVAAAANGREALELLRAGFAADLILLDLMMPVMNGWEFRAVQRIDPSCGQIPVVVLSGDGNVATKAEELGAAAYLIKPIDLADFERTVMELCHPPRAPIAAG